MHGDKIGRSLGFPTANVQLKHNRPPVAGIFAVKLHVLEGASFTGVASLGTRPTITSEGRLRLEVPYLIYRRPIRPACSGGVCSCVWKPIIPIWVPTAVLLATWTTPGGRVELHGTES
jgi:hypothetical protein